MEEIAELLEQELLRACDVRDKDSLKRFIWLLVENAVGKKEHQIETAGIRAEISVLAANIEKNSEIMRQGFAETHGLFELLQQNMDKRFEAVDKRFESMQRTMDQRFESMQQNMDKRFEAVDKRFESMQRTMDQRFESMQQNMDKRFEAVDKRFEAVDKRFESMQHTMDERFESMQQNMDKRFEAIDKRLGNMFTFMTIGFSLLTVIAVLFKFLA